jgi:CheY-specific phosphatase CheX
MDARDSMIDRLREVQVDFVNPFLSALHQTLKAMSGTKTRRGQVKLVTSNSFHNDTIIFMRVDGQIKGMVVIELTEELAKKFVSQFLLGIPISELDEMAKNSLTEFSLRMSEMARGQLVQKGFMTSISAFVNVNRPLQFSRERQFVTVTLDTDHGPFKVSFHVMKTAQKLQPQKQ